jgi:hypothetical protein
MLRTFEPESQDTIVLLAIQELPHRKIPLVFQYEPNQTVCISRKFLIIYKPQ